jgi:superfamily II DNA/RNA helicase
MTVVHPVSFESNDIPTTPEDTTLAGPTFGQLGLPQPLVTALERRGIRHPFAIQTSALPDALAGRDVLGKAATGSGKTLAFGLPLLARIGAEVKQGRRAPRGLVLVPTRELAQQVHDALAPLGQAIGVQLVAVYGGAPMYRQIQQLRRGVDVIIATPGRLQDLISQGEATLAEVVVTVLDEADFMADLGFLPVVKELLDQTASDAQRLLFSATLDGEVDRLVREFLHDAVTHSVDAAEEPVPDMTHHLFTVAPADRNAVVQELASGHGRSMMFTRTKHAARKLSRQLTAAGIPATELHGNLSQPARDRNLAGFSAGDVRVLVATDIAARGIHVDDVALVVHVDPPAEHKAYTHRSGRTARAGSAGDVVTLVPPAERAEVASMTRKAGIKAKPVDVGPGAREIVALVGEPAPRVDPEDGPAAASRKPAPQPAGGSGGGSRRGGGSGRGRGGGAGAAGGGARGGSGRGRGGGGGAPGGSAGRGGSGGRGSGATGGSGAGGGRRAAGSSGGPSSSSHSAAAHSARSGAGRGRSGSR